MVIIVFLPKPHASFLLIYIGCLLLETLDQYKEIAIRPLPEGQEMQVVGHYAIGIHHEFVQRRFGSQGHNNPRSPIAV